MLVSEGQEIALGEQAYRQTLRDNVVLHDPEADRIVRKVGERIARAADRPEYHWEFQVIDEPETVNAFCIPGGKVAVYTGIFPIARDEAGLAVILGHEVAHALLRHAGERMSHDEIVQILGMGLSVGLGGNPQLASTVMQAYGITAGLGYILPFSRSQESEADRVGLILMAKAGYDPRVALEVWHRMESKEQGAPPEFLSTHPGYETRTAQLQSWMPEALRYYHPVDQTVELLPALQTLDSPTAKAERELLKRIQAINGQVRDSRSERAVLQALAYRLGMDPSVVYQERQQQQLGYGQYGALRALSAVGRVSLSQVVAEYRKGSTWSELTAAHGARLVDLISWLGDVRRTSASLLGQMRSLPFVPRLP